MNASFPPGAVNPWVRPLLEERDGIEAFVLYFFLIITTAASYTAVKEFSRIKKPALKNLFITAAVMEAAVYIFFVKINPPMNEYAWMKLPVLGDYLVYLCVMGAGAAAFIYAGKYPKIVFIIITAALIPACFISYVRASVFDYNFVFGPAYRMVKGAPLHDIYFLYDFLLSWIASVFIKLNINAGYFQPLSQSSFFIFFTALYFFAAKFFRDRRLAPLLIISAVLLRLYANMSDPDALIQVTPLRLDLWIIPLLASFFLSPFSALTAALTGSLLILSQTFGLIYAASYAVLLAIMLMADFSMKRGMAALLNAAILALFYAASVIIFKRQAADTALSLQSAGIGFLRITGDSFYWYFPAICGAVFSMLMQSRKGLDERYFSTALFVILLAAGNLLYFFGRTHPNNLLNVSTLIMLTIFIFVDLAAMKRPKAAYLLPALIFAAVAAPYSGRIAAKVRVQADHLAKGRINSGAIAYPDVSFIKKAVNNDGRVYIASLNNQVFSEMNGNYSPQGYYFPMNMCIMKDETTTFLQGLLDRGYYIAADSDIPEETIGALKYKTMVTIKNIRLLKGF